MCVGGGGGGTNRDKRDDLVHTPGTDRGFGLQQLRKRHTETLWMKRLWTWAGEIGKMGQGCGGGGW